MSYTPEEEKAKNNKRLLKAWGALLTAVTVAGGTGYGMGSIETPTEIVEEGALIMRIDGCEQVNEGTLSVYHCGSKLIIIVPR